MTKLEKYSRIPATTGKFLSDIKNLGGIFHFMMKKTTKIFASLKSCCNFVAFFGRNKFMNLLCVVFFITTSQVENLGYYSSGYYTERSVIVPSRTEKVAFLNLNTFNFSFMEGTMKIQSNAKHSNIKLTPNSAKTVSASGNPADITLSMTGVKSNRYMHAVRIATFVFLSYETKGYISALENFVACIKAARTLYGDDRKALIGKKVIIK